MSMLIKIHKMAPNGRFTKSVAFDGWSDEFQPIFDNGQEIDLGDPYELAVKVDDAVAEQLFSEIGKEHPHFKDFTKLRTIEGQYVLSMC